MVRLCSAAAERLTRSTSPGPCGPPITVPVDDQLPPLTETLKIPSTTCRAPLVVPLELDVEKKRTVPAVHEPGCAARGLAETPHAIPTDNPASTTARFRVFIILRSSWRRHTTETEL